MAILDIYLLEALINGVLLGGVLALLSLGLNLVFGVIDVVWICYAELMMVGMYGIHFSYKGGMPFLAAAVVSGGIVRVTGWPQLSIQPGIRYTTFRSALATSGGSLNAKNWCLLITTANIAERLHRHEREAEGHDVRQCS